MSSTQQGERAFVAGNGDNPDPKQRDNAEARMNAAPLKGFEDLPDDHPMAKRAATMAAIEAANQLADGLDPESDEAKAARVAALAQGDPDAAPPIDAFTDKTPPADAPKPKVDVATDAKAQAKVQTDDKIVIDFADLDKYEVRAKVDGVEQLVPAAKALGQYQKGAAADVRLANATKLQREAETALANANNANKAVATAPAATAVAAARDTSVAKAKFKEASDALYGGEADKAAELFAEAVALATPETSGRSDATQDDVVKRVANEVKQSLSQTAVLEKLFTDYPDIKTKRAFATIADEYTNAFLQNGDDFATAVHKAGEALGEEYKLGKWAPQAAAVDTGRRIEGGPANRDAKLSAKKELDVITSGNARSTDSVERELTVVEQLAQMQKGRPGYVDEERASRT
jgi:hypothetical protein